MLGPEHIPVDMASTRVALLRMLHSRYEDPRGEEVLVQVVRQVQRGDQEGATLQMSLDPNPWRWEAWRPRRARSGMKGVLLAGRSYSIS